MGARTGTHTIPEGHRCPLDQWPCGTIHLVRATEEQLRVGYDAARRHVAEVVAERNLHSRVSDRLEPYQPLLLAGHAVGEPQRDLSADDIRELLRRGPLRFVVADIGTGPRWLPVESSFAFWKAEVQSHPSPLGAPASLDNFPGGYYYFASEWSPAAGPPIVLLEKAH